MNEPYTIIELWDEILGGWMEYGATEFVSEEAAIAWLEAQGRSESGRYRLITTKVREL